MGWAYYLDVTEEGVVAELEASRLGLYQGTALLSFLVSDWSGGSTVFFSVPVGKDG